MKPFFPCEMNHTILYISIFCLVLLNSFDSHEIYPLWLCIPFWNSGPTEVIIASRKLSKPLCFDVTRYKNTQFDRFLSTRFRLSLKLTRKKWPHVNKKYIITSISRNRNADQTKNKKSKLCEPCLVWSENWERENFLIFCITKFSGRLSLHFLFDISTWSHEIIIRAYLMIRQVNFPWFIYMCTSLQ